MEQVLDRFGLGTAVVVKCETVGVGQKDFVSDGGVKSTAPELAQYEAEI